MTEESDPNHLTQTQARLLWNTNQKMATWMTSLTLKSLSTLVQPSAISPIWQPIWREISILTPGVQSPWLRTNIRSPIERQTTLLFALPTDPQSPLWKKDHCVSLSVKSGLLWLQNWTNRFCLFQASATQGSSLFSPKTGAKYSTRTSPT